MKDDCLLREGYLDSGMRVVDMENSYVKVRLLPEKGADIYSVQYKPKNNVDVLWKSPWGANKLGSKAHHMGNSQQQWLDYYPGGWQVMFPNAGGECNYKGAFHTFHGEANSIPWEWKVETNNEDILSVIFMANLSRSPFRIERKVTLRSNEAKIQLYERVTNLGEEPIEYVWGHHIAFGAPFLSENCWLNIPAESLTSEVHDSLMNERLLSGETIMWPLAYTPTEKTVDFSKIPSQDTRANDLGYFTGLKSGWYDLYNKEMNLHVGVAWDLKVLPYVWLWQEFRGSFGYPFYGRCYVMGVEPCSTPISSGLEESIKRGYSKKILPGESEELQLSMVLFEGNEAIRNITVEGEVINE